MFSLMSSSAGRSTGENSHAGGEGGGEDGGDANACSPVGNVKGVEGQGGGVNSVQRPACWALRAAFSAVSGPYILEMVAKCTASSTVRN